MGVKRLGVKPTNEEEDHLHLPTMESACVEMTESDRLRSRRFRMKNVDLGELHAVRLCDLMSDVSQDLVPCTVNPL